MSESYDIECDEHGKAYATFVCRHLIERSNTDWHSSEPDEEHRWPDAWCGQCHLHFQAENAWNEASEQAVGPNTIRVLCHHCYGKILSQCTFHAVK